MRSSNPTLSANAKLIAPARGRAQHRLGFSSRFPITALALAGLLVGSAFGAEPELVPRAVDADLLTVAEKSDFKSTARHDEILALGEAFARKFPGRFGLAELGRSHEGRPIPLWYLSDRRISSAEQARAAGRPIALIIANIHAGEVCGKEAVGILARELLQTEDPLLSSLTLAIVPNYNPDGNERVAKGNRPGQNGPENGMGIRYNAQDLDLNRDFMKLKAPETRALVKAMRELQPTAFLDLHTTNGSLHRYLVTWDSPRLAAARQDLVTFGRDRLLPSVRARLAEQGLATFLYGNFAKDGAEWEMYPATPRYGIHYVGLRNMLGVLSEAYSYAPFKDRVFGTRDFVRGVLAELVVRRDELTALSAGPALPAMGDAARRLAIRSESSAAPKPDTVLGFAKQTRSRGMKPDADVEPTLFAPVGSGWLIGAGFDPVIENLRQHGVEVRPAVASPIAAESARIERVSFAPRAYQGHKAAEVKVTWKPAEPFTPATDAWFIPADQPLVRLAGLLLEPESEDGLTHWNFFDRALTVGAEFPVRRVRSTGKPAAAAARPGVLAPVALVDGPPQGQGGKAALPESVEPESAGLAGAETASPDEELAAPAGPMPWVRPRPRTVITGRSVNGLEWLDDGLHYTRFERGNLMKIEAVTGKATPMLDLAKLDAAAKAAGMGDGVVRALMGRRGPVFDEKKTALLVNHRNDLWRIAADGSAVTRLTNTPDINEELAEFSPDGKQVAFVVKGDLYCVNADGKVTRLSTDGGGDISTGKADWVYFEEIYNRKWKGFWWSPDSKRIAALRWDDTRVRRFTVTQPLTPRQDLEVTAYPKAGDPNPIVTIKLFSPDGANPVSIPAATFEPADDHLVLRLSWNHDGSGLFAMITDRAQTKLDLFRVEPLKGLATKLLTETTKAWVNDPGDPVFLADGSFVLASERDGWRHFYVHGADGKLDRRLTEGPWEARDILGTDPAGFLYFVGTKDSHIAEQLYRVPLAGGPVERLTKEPGWHEAAVSPSGKHFIDSWSSRAHGPKTVLRAIDGSEVRPLESSGGMFAGMGRQFPVEFLTIKTKDGFELEATIVKPKMEPGKKYPVWFMTYGGPHYPTISDRFTAGMGMDQFLAANGIIAFHCDPRSASGKGAVSAWTCYRQLGVQELKDLEEAADWLAAQPWVDGGRIGLAGHSYGGFMTAYALTHSKKFKAGISGAPVTDWANYDSIYTERYMDTPRKNPDGYRKTSAVKGGANLSGSLLLLHGFIDDNVHVQNTLQLIHALQQANRPFEMMIYPTARHGIFGAHYQRMQQEFIRKTMLGPEPATAPAAAPVPTRPRATKGANSTPASAPALPPGHP
jgi:dipeptidyl aminopeptidase/acylaminoacyl peptidase